MNGQNKFRGLTVGAAAGIFAIAALLGYNMSGRAHVAAEVQLHTASGAQLLLRRLPPPLRRTVDLGDVLERDRHGVIVVWPDAGPHMIVMANRQAAVDLLWCDADGRILATLAAVPACKRLMGCALDATATPTARALLALQSGTIERLHIRKGERLDNVVSLLQ